MLAVGAEQTGRTGLQSPASIRSCEVEMKRSDGLCKGIGREDG